MNSIFSTNIPKRKLTTSNAYLTCLIRIKLRLWMSMTFRLLWNPLIETHKKLLIYLKNLILTQMATCHSKNSLESWKTSKIDLFKVNKTMLETMSSKCKCKCNKIQTKWEWCKWKWVTSNRWTQVLSQEKEIFKKEISMVVCYQEQVYISYLTVKSLISWDFLMITGKNAVKKWTLLRPEELLWNLKILKIKKCSDNYKIWNKLKSKNLSLLNQHREHSS